ncbi:hypothetical protein K458DRAFT_327311 [Lentithecium fluviatile CBS 122367]|uniref:Zn(2)-C6 fungal-type domain-containing protein n=1 Tax=Lentithecium fluviatile CBS 122367 TaxID=1168545 RepID=A0A6G1JLZ4_9PLEO|nr:hypothetical protein K458DRAFT_327311 [Lentithecium fluviatile CBS 122367]
MANPSGATALKLRDSCDACASSKVKCHKQKPTCSRCQKRGVACHYLATKRAGRRYDSQRVDSTHFSPVAGSEPQLEQFDLDAWFGTSTTTGSTGSSGDDMFLQQLLSTTTSTIGTPSIQSSAVNSASTGSNDDLFMRHSISTVSTPCTPSNSLGLGSGVLSPANLSTMDLDDYLPSTMNLWTPDMPESCATDTLPPLDSSRESQPSGPDTTTAAPDSCLTRATQIMQQQFRQQITPKTSDTSCTLSVQADKPHTPVPALDAVIDANKQTIDAVGAMLQCPCLHDGYLLTILSLIVFKVLDSYGAAANAPEVQKTDVDAAEEDALYMAAQRVLGELHRVQRLVNQLSVKIKEQTTTDAQGGKTSGTTTPSGERRESEVSLPFSTVMLCQLEADMRKRLKSLSLGMAAHLRRD